MLRNQRTIAEVCRVEGFGYWSSRDVTVEFRPAAENTGIVFVRSDLGDDARVNAIVENRVEMPLRTALASGRATVEMVEHIMAALVGLRIDNCEVWVDQPEMPGCDGSSLAFVEALDGAGIVEQDSPRPMLIVPDVIRVGNDESWIEARPAKKNMRVKCRIDFGMESPIGRQTIELTVKPEKFRSELASARTFILKEEAEWLRSQGLGQRTTSQDLIVFDDLGPMDNPLRFEDECVRHKTLDLVGDLALAGCDLVGSFFAHCSGHRLNSEMVQALLNEGQLVEGWRRSA
jgi:UDP-3-O-[3-hydroxymyristoyl] N-acetylglucosamine deacetylase